MLSFTPSVSLSTSPCGTSTQIRLTMFLVALSIRAFETCSTDKESVTMYRDGSYSVSAAMTAESSTRFRSCSFGRCGADGGDGLLWIDGCHIFLPLWIGVKDDLSVVGFFLWLRHHKSDSKCSSTRDMPATSTADSCSVEYASGYEGLRSGGVACLTDIFVVLIGGLSCARRGESGNYSCLLHATLLEQSFSHLNFQTFCHSTVVHISFQQSLRSAHAIHI